MTRDDGDSEEFIFFVVMSRLVAEVENDLGKNAEMKEIVRERWSFDRINAINVI